MTECQRFKYAAEPEPSPKPEPKYADGFTFCWECGKAIPRGQSVRAWTATRQGRVIIHRHPECAE